MEQPEIERRRRELAEEYLSLPNAWSSRALAICEEFGKLSEEEDYLRRSSRWRKNSCL
jgi:hypothetical protein